MNFENIICRAIGSAEKGVNQVAGNRRLVFNAPAAEAAAADDGALPGEHIDHAAVAHDYNYRQQYAYERYARYEQHVQGVIFSQASRAQAFPHHHAIDGQ